MSTESKGRELGMQLVERMKAGTFPKNHLTNHGEDFTHGSEGLLIYALKRRMGSCGYVMMEKRLQKKGCMYLGY